MSVALSKVSKVLRKDLKMGYRLAKTVPTQSNTERCLVLRQQYAQKILKLLESGRRVINIDESWLNQTRFLRRIWAPTKSKFTITDKQVSPRLSLIAALDTDGKMWCCLTQANTDSDVMITFFLHLIKQLDREDAGWQENTTFLLDNAKWHNSTDMMERMANLKLDIIFSAPYC